MSTGGGGLSKLGTALTIIFVISVVALFTELFYVLWRRRVFRRQNPTVIQGSGGVGGDQISQYSSDCSVSSAPSSKELLYFFCIKPRETNSNTDRQNSNAPSQLEVVDIDVLKLQGMYGPSRFLFTINEEEREDFELPCAEKDQNQSETVISSEEGFSLDEESPEELVVVAVAEEEVDHVRSIDATPFSSPCASPVYFTPSASPVHELVVNARSTEEGSVSEIETAAFSLQVSVGL
ncbi:hypothetical protein Adt_07883 [Abeliophyllum distichum]|uniref:Uncharacterized protein n=1 Tax=Abeliophyllum distichum TaxID=126358 RepID=A0ABD1VBE0_9LAMI